MIGKLARALAGVLPMALAASAVAAPPVRVAVLPVVVHSLDQQDYLRDGLEDMLTTRLARSPALTVIGIEDPAQATSDIEHARQSGREVGAEYVLYGSFTRFGEGASIDLKCVSVRDDGIADPRSIFVQAGTLGEIIPRLDELADKVVRHVTTGGAGSLPEVAAGPSAGAAPGPQAGSLEDLRARVERLEHVIYGSGKAEEEELGGQGPAGGGDGAGDPKF